MSTSAFACNPKMGKLREKYLIESVNKDNIRLVQVNDVRSLCKRTTFIDTTPELLSQLKDKVGLIVDLTALVTPGFVNEAHNPQIHSFVRQLQTRDGEIQIFEGKIVEAALTKQEPDNYNPAIHHRTWQVTLMEDDGTRKTFQHQERITGTELNSDYTTSLDPSYPIHNDSKAKFKVGDQVRVRVTKAFDEEQFSHFGSRGSILLGRNRPGQGEGRVASGNEAQASQ